MDSIGTALQAALDKVEVTGAQVDKLTPASAGNNVPANRKQRGNGHSGPLSGQDLSDMLDVQESAENGVKSPDFIQPLIKLVTQLERASMDNVFLGRIYTKILAWSVDLQRIFFGAMCDAQKIAYDTKETWHDERDSKGVVTGKVRTLSYNGPIGRAGLILSVYGSEKLKYLITTKSGNDTLASKRVSKAQADWKEFQASEAALMAGVPAKKDDGTVIPESIADRLLPEPEGDGKKTVSLSGSTFKALYMALGNTLLTDTDGSKYLLRDRLATAARDCGTDAKRINGWISSALSGK